jgi:hypothetical protein
MPVSNYDQTPNTKPNNLGGSADQMDDDPVLSLLGPTGLALDDNANTKNPVEDPYHQSPNSRPVEDPYHQSPNSQSQPGLPAINRPSAFDRQPNINDATPMGQARIPGPMGPHYIGEQKKNVKYISNLRTRREKYQIEIGATMLRRKMVFDTKQIKQHFQANYERTGRGFVSSATLGEHRKGTLAKFDTPPEWKEEALIWVCAPDPETEKPVIYSHVCKVDRFHHSSMVNGTDVIGAGEWIVRKGKLWKISANSGHYQPTIDFLYRAVLQMSGAFQGDTTVFLYDSVDDNWVNYPIRLFVSAPTASNRYWTHPRAPTA